MTTLRLSAKLFILALSLGTAGLLAVHLSRATPPDGRDVVLAMAFAGLMALAHLFPLDLSFKIKLFLDTSVVFAALLLFDPAIAMLVAGIGTLAAEAIRRQPAAQSTFNVAQTMLQGGMAALALLAVGWDTNRLRFDQPAHLVTLGVAAIVVYLVNTLSVATVVGLQSGLSPLIVWRQAATPFDYAERSVQFVIGILGAMVVDLHIWAIPLLAIPSFVLHRVLHRHTRNRRSNMDTAVQALADMVDLRDPRRAGHSRRVEVIAGELSRALNMVDNEVELITRAARVHDVGKLLVDQSILTKPETLSRDEWLQLKRHAAAGAELLTRFGEYALIAPYVRHHHERVDGTGYPDGLHGDQIPLGARIIAVADALDAMSSPRPYRPALSRDQIVAEFNRQRGQQWDDRVVGTVLQLMTDNRITIPHIEPQHSLTPLDEAGNHLLDGTTTLTHLTPDNGQIPTVDAQLLHRAFHDPLTDLPNRSLFMDRLGQAFGGIGHSGDVIAVIFLDLDNFKVINDTYGHDAGDQLLIEVARRLVGCVRPSDTVARLGGDEFTILLEGIAVVSDATRVADRIVETLATPIQIGGHSVSVTASLGVAASTDGAGEASDLLRHADLAMYAAKNDGKEGYMVFDPSMHDQVRERQQLEDELRKTVEGNELHLVFQPKVLLETGRVVGTEALVRWEHPVRGQISSPELMALAEETGLSVAILRWSLKEACRQMQEWQAAMPDSWPLTIAVNLSIRQFQWPDLVPYVCQVLEETGMAPHSLALEIPESVAVDSPEFSVGVLQELKDLGIQLVIDDVGTGYSVLRYLKRFPVDALKLDYSLVQGINEDPGDMAIVRAVITFARTLNRQVMAEGIETAEQLDLLRELGCDSGQGFFFAMPLQSDAATALITSAVSHETFGMDLVGHRHPNQGRIASPEGRYAMDHDFESAAVSS